MIMTDSNKKILDGITHKDLQIRLQWAKQTIYKPTKEHFDIGINDPDPNVRALWASKVEFIPTNEQLENGLKDKSWEVRLAWAKRNYKFTKKQILRGLKDKSKIVRLFWIEYVNTNYKNWEKAFIASDETLLRPIL